MNRNAILGFIAGSLLIVSPLGAQNAMVIAGAGPSTVTVQHLAEAFMQAYPQYQIQVPPKSIKHAGGIKWATTGNIFGRTGRDLTDQDKAENPSIRYIPIAREKIAFAVDKGLGVTKLTMAQWEGVLKGTITNWKDVGGPDRAITLLGRAAGESVFSALITDYSFASKSPFKKVYDTEDEIIRAIGTITGSMGFSTKSVLEGKNLEVLDIKSFDSGLQFGLVYDVSNEKKEEVQLMKAFLAGKGWRKVLADNDLLAP